MERTDTGTVLYGLNIFSHKQIVDDGYHTMLGSVRYGRNHKDIITANRQ